MRFGVFYEHQLPRPWTANSEFELLQNSLAQIEIADQLGYDYAWEVEHHFTVGALGFQFVSPEAAKAWVNRYYNSFVKHPEPLADYQTNPNIAMVCGIMCAETDELAFERAHGWTFFIFALQYYSKHGYSDPGKLNMWEKYCEWRETPKAQEALFTGLIGSPETIRQKLLEFEGTGVDQVILLNQAGRTTHENIVSSLELFGREVMPEFQAREPEHQAWKSRVLSGEIELEELDTSQHTKYLVQPDEHLAASRSATDIKRLLAEREPKQ